MIISDHFLKMRTIMILDLTKKLDYNMEDGPFESVSELPVSWISDHGSNNEKLIISSAQRVDGIYEANRWEKDHTDNGFSRKRHFRKIASIPVLDFSKNKELAIAIASRNDNKIVNIIKKNPQWCTVRVDKL